jgi:hypothetical protein
MRRIRAEYVFRVDSAWFSTDLLGRRYAFRRRDYDAAIEVPGDGTAFGDLLHSALKGFLLPSDTGRAPEGVKAVSALRISLVQSVELSSDRFESSRQLADFWRDGQPVAHAILRQFVDWIRVRCGQAWVGIFGQRYEMLIIGDKLGKAQGRVFDDESGQQFPVMISMGFGYIRTPPGGQVPVSSSDAEFLVRMLAESIEAPTPEMLLADALHHASVVDPQPQRAVLLAAIACETKIKSVLQNRVSPEKAGLAELLVARPRSAAALFSEILKAAVGPSLKASRPDLARRIECLFQVRNRVAHSGEVPTLHEADAAVSAAREVFEWLDGELSKEP